MGLTVKTSLTKTIARGTPVTSMPHTSPSKGQGQKNSPSRKVAAAKKGPPAKSSPKAGAKNQIKSAPKVAAKTNVKANAKPLRKEKPSTGGQTAGSLGTSTRRSISSDICREVACEGLATSGGYCRLHYIKNWKKIQRKALILKEGKLNQYIEELVAKYPDKYLDAIRQDLTNNREFSKVVRDLELDEGFDEFDAEGENVDSLIDSIKRDIDDEDEVY